eukprot:GDKI01006494.1.p1 GENE.GDKI01006494.1~~GDKI01006494.1.p1  ORF type:complete len:144 (+),score=33.72 GDKI01006494.1:38-469(+)
MSQTLIWHLIRDNNSFMVKRERTSRRGAVQFSSEPGNLMNAHSFKYSGLANNRAVDISSDLLIRTKDSKVENKPSKVYSAGETLHAHHISKAQAKAVALVSATRPDLLAAAKVRVTKAVKGLRAKNANRPKKVAKSAKRGSKN